MIGGENGICTTGVVHQMVVEEEEIRPARPRPPPGWKNFIDLNGNGRRDPGEPWLGGRGPVGLFGLQGPAGKISSLLLGRNWGNYPPHHLHDFADQLSRNNSTPGHPWPRPAGEFQPYRLKYDGRSPYHILHSNHAINRNNNQPSPVRERHLLLRIDSMVLEPGEKGHFTVSPGAGLELGCTARSGNHKTIFGGISGKRG